jgi:hypothetical protein
MKVQKTIALLVAAITLSAIAAQGQDLFRVKFKATCKPSDGNSSKMTEKDLIEQCVGTGFTKKELSRNFALVYNPVSDSIQVVNQADGALLCDVFQFQGGTNVVGDNKLERFVFVFSPNQSEAIGSAIITEKPGSGSSGSNSVTKAKINAKIQFTMSESNDSNALASVSAIDSTSSTNGNSSSTNSSSIDTNNVPDNSNGDAGTTVDAASFVQTSAITGITTAANVQVCSGSFSAGKLFVAGANNGGDSSGQSVEETVPENTPPVTGTNDVSSINGTNLVTTVSTNGTLIITTNTIDLTPITP